MLWKLKTFDLSMSNSSANTSISLEYVMNFCWYLCTPTRNDLLCHIMYRSYQRLGIFLVHVGCDCIYISFGAIVWFFFVFFFCILCAMILPDDLLYCVTLFGFFCSLWLPEGVLFAVFVPLLLLPSIALN